MKCYNCGSDFEGNFCPRCGARAKSTSAQENPYEHNYTQVNNYQPADDHQPPTDYRQTQNCQPQETCPQNYVQPLQYVPQVPANQGMSGGKIAALIISILFGVILIFCAIPFGCIMCLSGIENRYSDSHIDSSYYGMGSSVNAGNFVYSLTSAEYSNTYNGKKADDGKQFVTVNIEVRNTSDELFSNTVYYTLYDNNYLTNEIDTTFPEYDSITLPPGKIGSFKIVYEISKQPESLELFMETEEDDEPYGEYKFTFTIDD